MLILEMLLQPYREFKSAPLNQSVQGNYRYCTADQQAAANHLGNQHYDIATACAEADL